ncbi:flagellar biosynthetic protein FliQ [Litorimonas taeanensis]|uniref:Flagellar biosynthetic protein FliQ n=1 Tax=Litorimonas taeanensis TaxID=568099 RepID=A0A420WMC4_9PROT|nr:flagellar biosynthetic protein FliQ [Litorimonas taeanensis]RKQ72140.1 flagellar biosynthetic protein FliQ [Litorimonas taeanensis]
MTDAEILSILRQFFWSAALIATPLLLAALLVGMLVGLLQALTSIQEMTLTFVPKLGVMLLVFIATAGFMARVCVNLFDTIVIPIISS